MLRNSSFSGEIESLKEKLKEFVNRVEIDIVKGDLYLANETIKEKEEEMEKMKEEFEKKMKEEKERLFMIIGRQELELSQLKDQNPENEEINSLKSQLSVRDARIKELEAKLKRGGRGPKPDGPPTVRGGRPSPVRRAKSPGLRQPPKGFGGFGSDRYERASARRSPGPAHYRKPSPARRDFPRSPSPPGYGSRPFGGNDRYRVRSPSPTAFGTRSSGFDRSSFPSFPNREPGSNTIYPPRYRDGPNAFVARYDKPFSGFSGFQREEREPSTRRDDRPGTSTVRGYDGVPKVHQPAAAYELDDEDW
uniref:Uncharacterized protein n=1 Tax=Caenorhabditis tropicalis TaxID=1561998 RepID=A0A1I7TPK6_9PELO